MKYFNPFVLPFVIGVVILLVVCCIKFYRWYNSFDRLQKAIVRKNMFSYRFIPALWEMFIEALLHKKISKRNFLLGYMHRSIAFGWFLLIVVGAIETELAIKGYKPFWVGIFFSYFVHQTDTFKYAHYFAHLMDALLLYVLSGIFLANIKSIYSRFLGLKKTTKHSLFDIFAKFSLWLIFPLRLLSESLTATLYNNGGFLTQSIGNLFSVWFANMFELTSWTLYSFALGTFFVCLPISRYMHIFTELVFIYFKNLKVTENEYSSGYTTLELSACSRCGICIDNCPLNKELDIYGVQSVYFLRDIRNNKLKDEVADNCLICSRCSTECPVGIDLMAIRRQKRHKKNIDSHNNYNFVDNVQAFNSIGRVAYFAGCMSHLTPGIIESMKNIFDAVDQKYWFMDEEATICCGRPLYQQGFFNQARDLRSKNTSLIKQSGANLLITSCPICYYSFKNEYNLPIEVVHHSQYIAKLIKEGKLEIDKTDIKYTYHDPCELGRGSGIYEEPRMILQSAGTLIKTKNEKEKSFCCGHNLGNLAITLEEKSKISDASFNNLVERNPDVIATACPMCKKSFMHGRKFPVKDIAEIVNSQIIKESKNKILQNEEALLE